MSIRQQLSNALFNGKTRMMVMKTKVNNKNIKNCDKFIFSEPLQNHELLNLFDGLQMQKVYDNENKKCYDCRRSISRY